MDWLEQHIVNLVCYNKTFECLDEEDNLKVVKGILLWREIPMAWGGTKIDSLTLEINPFQYAREIKYITLKDQNSYLFQMVEVDPR